MSTEDQIAAARFGIAMDASKVARIRDYCARVIEISSRMEEIRKFFRALNECGAHCRSNAERVALAIGNRVRSQKAIHEVAALKTELEAIEAAWKAMLPDPDADA